MMHTEIIIEKIKNNFDDIITIIQAKIPYYCKILNSSDWKSIAQRYHKRYKHIIQNQILNIKSGALIDHILFSYQDQEVEQQLIECINQEIDKALKYCITANVSSQKINNILREAIMSFDIDSNSSNSDFENRLNEIFAFNKLCSCNQYKLIAIEEKITNLATTADFTFRDTETQEIIFIDVVTFQNISPDFHKDNDTFNNYVSSRIERKYMAKVKHGSSDIPLYILPIVQYKSGMEKFTFSNKYKHSLQVQMAMRYINDEQTIIGISDANYILSEISKQKSNPLLLSAD